MKTFRVWAKSIGYCYLDVKANDKEEAMKIARNTDGGDYIEDGGSWEWDNIDDITKYKFSKQGRKKAKKYLAELKAKRKEIVDAGLDTVEESDAYKVTIEDILDDAINVGFDDEDEAVNGYFVTDNYDSDYPYCFKLGVDIVEAKGE